MRLYLHSIAFAASLSAGLLMASCAPQPMFESATIPLATSVVVHKRAHVLRVYRGNSLVREFKVALGRGGLGPKVRQGDGLVPEGNYVIASRNPNSAFHLSLQISYPTPEQVRAAAAKALRPGGQIMIHGLPNGQEQVGESHRQTDWTDGCIAVTNPEVEWLWRSVRDNTPILILP